MDLYICFDKYRQGSAPGTRVFFFLYKRMSSGLKCISQIPALKFGIGINTGIHHTVGLHYNNWMSD